MTLLPRSCGRTADGDGPPLLEARNIRSTSRGRRLEKCRSPSSGRDQFLLGDNGAGSRIDQDPVFFHRRLTDPRRGRSPVRSARTRCPDAGIATVTITFGVPLRTIGILPGNEPTVASGRCRFDSARRHGSPGGMNSARGPHRAARRDSVGRERSAGDLPGIVLRRPRPDLDDAYRLGVKYSGSSFATHSAS